MRLYPYRGWGLVRQWDDSLPERLLGGRAVFPTMGGSRAAHLALTHSLWMSPLPRASLGLFVLN